MLYEANRVENEGVNMRKMISKKDIIFRGFYSDKILGSGLGLHFVKRALVLMGHDITVDSAEGKFTIMNVCFGAYAHA